MSDTSQEHLARRLDRLERENQRLKRLGALALIGLAALVIMGQATSAPVARACRNDSRSSPHRAANGINNSTAENTSFGASTAGTTVPYTIASTSLPSISLR